MTEKEIMHVISAYREGYRIQSKPIGSAEWKDDLTPSWNFEQLEYRVKLVPEDMTSVYWQMAEYPIKLPALVECKKEISGALGGVPVDGLQEIWYEIRDRVEPGQYYISLYSIKNLPRNNQSKKERSEKRSKKFRFTDLWNIFKR
jgi:hypothetical protein